MVPAFKILRLVPLYAKLPETPVKGIITRAVTAVACCLIAYQVPNLGQFLNFQGALTGTLICFVFPTLGYWKVFGYTGLS